MKTLPIGLRPEFYRLYSEPRQLFELYTIPDALQPTHFFVADNQDLDFGGVHYTALAIKRSAIKSEEGTVLSEVEIGLDNVDLEFKALVASGAFNRKRVVVKMVFMNKLEDAANYITLLDGYLDEPKGDSRWVSMTVKPYPIFEHEYPKRTFQPSCNWSFGDAQCGMDKAANSIESFVLEGSDESTIIYNDADAPREKDYWVPGYVVVISPGHPEQGSMRPICASSATENRLQLRLPFTAPLGTGTSVIIQVLCGKTIDHCRRKFNNFDNFGGFPFVPLQPTY